MIECIRTEYFEDESFFFLGRTKISSIFATVFRRSSNNAEVAQLVEHNLAKVGVAGSSPVFRSRKKSLARMVELVDTRDLKSLGQ